jgi:hypothetical protein
MSAALTRGVMALMLSAGSAGAAGMAYPRNAAAADGIFADGFDRTFFVMPYSAGGNLPPTPASRKFGLSTELQTVDVGFIVDTTGTMGAEIAALKTGFSSSIVPALQALVPDLAIGIAAHDDVPYSTFGTTGDLPFYLQAPQGFVTTVTSDSVTAVNALTTHNGSDGPEAQVLALHHAIADSGIIWPTGSVPPAGAPDGTFGALHFRADAFAIVLNITDASHHNGRRALDKSGATYDAALQNTYSFETWDVDDAVAQVNAVGSKYIGISADGGTRGVGVSDPYGYQAYITDKTDSNVTPENIAPAAGCAPTQCCTGVNGAGVAADGPGGSCRSVFSIPITGAGLAAAVTRGVATVLHSIKFDVYVVAQNDPAEPIDVVGNFLLKVEPDPSGGTDPASNDVCMTIPVEQLADNCTGPSCSVGSDGTLDTILQVNPDPFYCFNVTPKANSTVPATSAAQIFRAWLRVLAIKPGGSLVLGQDREVFFLVPPG